MENGFSDIHQFIGSWAFTLYHTVGIQVEYCPTGTIKSCYAIVISMNSYTPPVIAARNITAKTVLVVRKSHLSKECGRKVGLVAHLLQASRRLDGSTNPHHWNVVVAWVFNTHFTIIDAMVGEQDDERILPGRRLAQVVNKTAYTLVEVVEGVEYLVVHLLDRHVPWLVAR